MTKLGKWGRERLQDTENHRFSLGLPFSGICNPALFLWLHRYDIGLGFFSSAAGKEFHRKNVSFLGNCSLGKDYLQACLKAKEKKSVCVLLKQKTKKSKKNPKNPQQQNTHTHKKKWKTCNYFIAASISNNTEQIAVITKSSINMGSTILDNN